ncbi:MAG: R3H domain-containing nucleic acid-binding protein [bacterium]
MEKTEIIKQTITKLLETMGFNGEVFVDDSDKDNILANIQTDQAGFLIGQAGANLEALQYIVRAMVSKKNGASVQFLLDVNDYQKNNIELLKGLARNIAEEALLKRIAVTLQPMPAYKRRIIHTALMSYPEISTESIGDEPERRIVVKPIK